MSIIEQIKAEVERQMENARNVRINGTTQQAKEADAIIHTLQDHLNFLSTLQEQPVSPPNWYPNPLEEQPVCEGFDREFSKFSNDVDAEHPFPICVDEYKDFARHFYELGRQSKPKVSEDVENASNEYASHIQITDTKNVCGADEWLYLFADLTDAFKAGANWQKEQDEQSHDNVYDFIKKKCEEKSFHDDFEMASYKNGIIDGYNAGYICAKTKAIESDMRGYERGKADMREQMLKEAVEGEVWGEVYSSRRFVKSDWLGPETGKPGDKVHIIIVKED